MCLLDELSYTEADLDATLHMHHHGQKAVASSMELMAPFILLLSSSHGLWPCP